jgi:hypothetical protein
MIVLVILGSIGALFAGLALTEPQTSSNFTIGKQALAVADGGVEWAILSLSNSVISGTPDPTTSTPYINPVAIAGGQYTVRITCPGGGTPPCVPANRRQISSAGFVPTSAAPRGQRTVQAIVATLRDINPPCALCVKGELDISGSATLDGLESSCASSGYKFGSYTAQTTTIGGSGAEVYGSDANHDPKKGGANVSGVDYAQLQPASSFDAFTFTQEELAILKSMAKASGTYIRPPSSGSEIKFGSSNPLPSGLVFVDTFSGNPIPDPPVASDLAAVRITGADASGWLVVRGSLRIDGNVTYHGLVYAANDIVYRGTGTGEITGAMISMNVVDTVATTIDSSTLGNATIKFNCHDVKNGRGKIKQGFFVVPGTWTDVRN